MRRALIGLAVFVCLLGACYAALPWLVGVLVLPRLADSLGVEAITADVGYPRLEHLFLSRLQVDAAAARLNADDIRLGYDLEGLRKGRLASIDIGHLQLTMKRPAIDPAGTAAPDATTSRTLQPIAPDTLLSRVPADRIGVEHLEITIEAVGFAGSGTLSLDPSGLDVQLTGQRPDIARDLRAVVTIERTGAMKVSLQDPDLQAPSFLQFLAVPDDEQIAVQGEFSIRGYSLELIQSLSGLPAGKGTVSGEVRTRLPWPFEALPAWQTLTATARVDADWSLADPAIELDGASATIEMNEGTFTVTPVGDITVSLGELNLTATLTGGAFDYRDGVITSEDAELKVVAETPDLLGAAQVRTVRMTPTAQTDLALSGSMQLARGALRLQGGFASSLTKAGSAYEGSFDFDGNADASALMEPTERRLQDQPLQLSGAYTLEDDVLEALATVTTGSIAGLPFEVEHDLGSGHGSLTFSHTQSIREPFLNRLLPGWQAPYDIDRGEVTLNGRLDWQDELNGSIQLRPHAVTAHYDDYTVYGAAGELNFGLRESTLSLQPSTLNAEAVDIGLPMTNLNLEISGSPETLHISHASAEVLSGQATTTPFDYRTESGSADFTITLTDIDLSEILALEGDKVSGTGRLSGTIPVSLRDNTVRVEGGTVTAGTPGRIMLSPTLTAGITQPGLDIALAALEDFNYDALGVNVSYDSEGNMLLGVRLEGSNPDLENGRPVHFNLNISENIPVLLQSLRLQDNFTKAIERQVNR